MKTLGGKDLEFARNSAHGLGYLFGHFTKREAWLLDQALAGKPVRVAFPADQTSKEEDPQGNP